MSPNSPWNQSALNGGMSASSESLPDVIKSIPFSSEKRMVVRLDMLIPSQELLPK